MDYRFGTSHYLVCNLSNLSPPKTSPQITISNGPKTQAIGQVICTWSHFFILILVNQPCSLNLSVTFTSNSLIGLRILFFSDVGFYLGTNVIQV